MTLPLYKSFLTASIFTTSLSLLKSTEIDANLSTSNSLFKLLDLVGTTFNWSISNLSTLDFKLAK